MSGMAFGQREGKVLWEKEDSAIDTYSSQYFRVSPKGNTFLEYNPWAKVYNTNGSLSWRATDIYKKSSTISTTFQAYNTILKDYGLLEGRNNKGLVDSVFQMDKDFNIVKRWSIDGEIKKITPLEDGPVYIGGNNTITKYDANGKEEWTHVGDEIVDFATRTFPYIGISVVANQKPKFVIFNKKGVKLGITETPQHFNQIFGTKDNGFWILNMDSDYIKFDSTGKVTATISELKNIKNWIQNIPSITADNSLILYQLQANGLEMLKLSPSGRIDRLFVTMQINNLTDAKLYFNYKIVPNQNKVMFTLPLKESNLPEANMKCKIGVINFDDLSKSWNKDIFTGTSNDKTAFPVTFQAENTFFVVNSSYIQPNIKHFTTHDVNGTLKWKSPYLTSNHFASPLLWKIIDNHVYFDALIQEDSTKNQYTGIGSIKVRFTDGKLMWNRNVTMGVYGGDLNSSIQKNKNGEDVILFSKYISDGKNAGFPYKYANIIETLNDDGTTKWSHLVRTFEETINTSYDFFFNQVAFKTTDDNKLIVYVPKQSNSRSYFLRKISPCEDLNALTITGKTEACPTEKVKLSIPKQEGITYQWQKDGKDIPNVKDVVYDFSESGTYTVVAKDELCQNTVTSNALKISIRSLPNTEITAPKSTFCDGEKTTIATRTNGTFFQWQKDGKDIPNATTGIYEVSQSGDYRVSVRDDKCPQVGYSNVYTIITKKLPEANISTDIKGVIYEPFTVKMSANLGTNLAYQWLKDDAIIPNETKVNYEAKKSGKYNVIVMQDGCEKRSDALTISILIPLSNSEEISEDQVQVYPNPSKGEFKIILPKSLKSADVQLLDTFGRERLLVYVGEQAQAEGLTQGVYFVRISKGEKTVTSKLIIE